MNEPDNNNENNQHDHDEELEALDLFTLREMQNVLQERFHELRSYSRVISGLSGANRVNSSETESSSQAVNTMAQAIILPTVQSTSTESINIENGSQLSKNYPLVEVVQSNLIKINTIEDFPNEIMYKILKNLSFDSIGKKRLVSKRFNTVCCDILNSEFKCLRNSVQTRLQELKCKMPRRESARRQHALAREFDIIETINMRLSLMYTMFSKHIEREHCPFFPGQVLDEVHQIMRYLKITPELEFAYKVTDELFDLSTMAVEYFKEHIEPSLPDITYISSFNDCFLIDNGSNSPGNSVEELKLSSIISETKSPMNSQEYSYSSTISKRPITTNFNHLTTRRIKKLETRNKKFTSVIKNLRNKITFGKQKIKQHQKQIHKYQAYFDKYDQKLDATCSKLGSVLEELSKCKTEIQYLRSTPNLQSQDNLINSNSQPTPMAATNSSSSIPLPIESSSYTQGFPSIEAKGKRKLDSIKITEDGQDVVTSNKKAKRE